MLVMNVPTIGSLAGEGTISPKGEMNFTMLAKLSGGALAATTGTMARGGVVRADERHSVSNSGDDEQSVVCAGHGPRR